MAENNFDVVVIGGGPGGYVAAIRAAQLGLRTACVEGWLGEANKPALGGTCLNVGCIPSKALLDSSHHYSFIRHEAAEHGINVAGPTLDVNKMIGRKVKVVQTMRQGIVGLFRKHKIEWLPGMGRLLAGNQVEMTPTGEGAGAKFTVQGTHIIIATGSVSTKIPPAPIDNELIVDSTGALAFNDVPRRLGIIGAGVIGLELGSVWNRLGSKVVILEALEQFLAAVDRPIAADAEKALRKQGLDIKLGAKVIGTSSNNREVTVSYETAEGRQELVVDKLIVAVGRSPNTQHLGAAEAGLNVGERGTILVDENCRTNLPNVWAVGDVVRGPMLAHKASEEGVAVAERIAGKHGHVNYETIPWVIYTWPEIAWVGKTEQQLKSEGIEFNAGSFPFLASGRARAMGEPGGLVRILAHKDTDRILGVHIFGPNASELIAEAVLAMEFEGSAEDIALTIHAHPTLAEAVHEAALGVAGRSLHF
jgi:dihydrolipoamide dehydrogenase